MYLEEKIDLVILMLKFQGDQLGKIMATQQDVSNAIAALSTKVNTAASAAASEIQDVNAKLTQLASGGGTVQATDLQPLIDQLTPVAAALDQLTANLQAEDAAVGGAQATPAPSPAASPTGTANTGTPTAAPTGTPATDPTSAPGTSTTPTT